MNGTGYKKGDESPNLPEALRLFGEHWEILTEVKGFRNHTLKLARRVARKMDRCPNFFKSGTDIKGFLIRLVNMDPKEFDREEKGNKRERAYGYTGTGFGEDVTYLEVSKLVYHDFPIELSGSISNYARELVAERSPVTVDSVRERFKVERPVAVRIIDMVRTELEEELL